MAGRKPSGIGLMIRDVLRGGKVLDKASINREVNALRKSEGMKRVTYKYISRLVDEGKTQGIITEVGREDKAEGDQVDDHPELNYRVILRITRGYTNDERWELLPRLARWKGEVDLKPPTGYASRFL